MRSRKPSVTRADLDRVRDFLQTLGVKLASVEIEPGRVRLVTTDGADLTLPNDKENLDRELADWRARNGQGGTQGRA